MDLVDEVDLAVLLTELVLRIYEDQSTLAGHLLTTCEEGVGVGFELLVVFFANEARADDLFTGDILVMPYVFFGRWGDDRTGEGLVFTHTFGELDTTEGAFTSLIGTPCRASEVATDDHLDAEGLAAMTQRYHWVGGRDQPVGDDISCSFEEVRGDLIEHLPLVGDALREDHVEGRDTVGSDHRYLVSGEEVDITDLAMIDPLLMWEMKVGVDERLCHSYACMNLWVISTERRTNESWKGRRTSLSSRVDQSWRANSRSLEGGLVSR